MAGILGLDLGTSSIKALLLDGKAHREWQVPCAGAENMADAVEALLLNIGREIPLRDLDAMGLSGQTGTYFLLDERMHPRHFISWQQPGREEALRQVLSGIPQADFLRMTGMEHPRLASYPLPTLRYLQDVCPPNPGDLLLQPKDYLVWLLCGEPLSDVGSWRALVHPETREFAEPLLRYGGVSKAQLPRIANFAKVDAKGAQRFALREGMPVAVGLNDYYSGLFGMGVEGPGIGFDVSGTSEHVGCTQSAHTHSPLICSPYLDGYVHYGVTASSGASLAWARAQFGQADPHIPAKAPLFLPYLQGERAPVFDPDARGMFVGLTTQTDTNALLYSVYEGVTLSLYQIHQMLGTPKLQSVRATGGATASALLNRMKASLWSAPLEIQALTCGSALGAARMAGAVYQGETRQVMPETALRDRLLERFAGFGALYPAWQHFCAHASAKDLF